MDLGGIVSPAAATARTCSTGVGRIRKGVGAVVERCDGCLGRGGVGDAALRLDVLLGHPERAAQDQRLEDRGVQPAVWLGPVRQRGVDRGRVLEA